MKNYLNKKRNTVNWTERQIVSETGMNDNSILPRKYVEIYRLQITRQFVPTSICSVYINGLVYDCSNSSALAMDLLQSCTKPSIYKANIVAVYIFIRRHEKNILLFETN